MSNRLKYCIAGVILFGTICILFGVKGEKTIYDKVLRFHIIANSDSDEDQTLKYKVRDAVVAEVSNDMKAAGIEDREQAIRFVRDNTSRYEKIAEEVIKSNGYDYAICATLGKHWFPVKEYGKALYPEGEYEAYRIIIGDGEGKNWWCVLFPSLCVVDGIYNTEGTTENETDDVTKAIEDNNIEIKSAFIEWLKHMW